MVSNFKLECISWYFLNVVILNSKLVKNFTFVFFSKCTLSKKSPTKVLLQTSSWSYRWLCLKYSVWIKRNLKNSTMTCGKVRKSENFIHIQVTIEGNPQKRFVRVWKLGKIFFVAEMNLKFCIFPGCKNLSWTFSKQS